MQNTYTANPSRFAAARCELEERGNGRLVVHAVDCDVETDGRGCSCWPYAVQPFDRRTTVEILAAAEQHHREH